MRPAGKQNVVSHIVAAHELSQRRACWLDCLNLATWQHKSLKRMMLDLCERIIEMAGEHCLHSYWLLHILLRREGRQVNHKTVHWIYREEGLQVRKRKRKRIGPADREPVELPERVNEHWSMDFMSDVLSSGTRFRTLNIVDEFSRECPAIEVDTSLPGTQVIRVLERLNETTGLRPRPSSSTTAPN